MSEGFDIGAIPDDLAARPQWLVWKFEPGEKKPKKMPYYASGKRRTGVQGSDTDRAALVSLAAAHAASSTGYSGVGFAFLPGDGLIGIDIDACIDVDGVVLPRAASIIAACDSYTEFSPSGKGVHIIVAGESETFKSNDIGLEVFCGRQFFTFTANPFPSSPASVNAIDMGVLGRLRATVQLAKADAAKASSARVAPAMAPMTDERAKLESALTCINANCGYDEWYKIGMAIFDALGESGFSVWDHWSGKSDKYPGSAELEKKWKSFKAGGGVTAASVFKIACDAGWRPPQPARLASMPRAVSGSPRDKAAPAQAVPGVEDIATGKPAKARSAPRPAAAEALVLPGDDEAPATWHESLIRKPANSRIEDCRENVFTILVNDPALAGVVGLDEFSMTQVKRRAPPWASDPGEWTERDDFSLGMFLGTHYQLVIKSDGAIEKAVSHAASSNKFNPVVEYLDSRAWDGMERLGTWLHDVAGVAQSPYYELIGRLFIMSMVARAYQPGCQMDYAPVFEGGQGAGKSSLLRMLGGQWYKETPFKVGDKDGYLAIQGAWLYEIAELDSFNKGDITTIKAFITNTVDDFRAPYGRRNAKYPRRTCFAATTNQDEYLKDTTGARRFWPVRCGTINLPLLGELRDQLFAEAKFYVDAGVKWHPTREQERDLIKPEQEERELEDVWYPRIWRFVEGIAESEDRQPLPRLVEVTMEVLLTKALHIEIGKLSAAKGESTRVGNVMKSMGWHKKRRGGGAREWYYVRPDAPAAGGDDDEPR